MRLIVAGAGTDVGKTIVSAIIVKALGADYYKPVQCGSPRDSDTIRALVGNISGSIRPEAYFFDYPCSPHFAAEQSGVQIDYNRLAPRDENRPLVIEGSGGVLVPINYQHTWLDLACSWNAQWIVVSRHYLGSINHTLLTIEAIRRRNQRIAAVVFNGNPHKPSEDAIAEISKIESFLHLALSTVKCTTQ